MTEYINITLYNDVFTNICSDWNLNCQQFSKVLYQSRGLLMGSTALACVINDDTINDDIDVFVDSQEGCYILHNYLIERDYTFMKQTNLTEYSGMAMRITWSFELIVFTYKYVASGEWTGSRARTFQIILCNNVTVARDNVDIGATQCAFNGKEWSIPRDHLSHLSDRITWIRPDICELSRYEREVRVEKYKKRGFKFIDTPSDVLADALSLMKIN